MMRIFYEDEGPIDTLLQIAAGPVRDGDLVGKPCRDLFVKHGWVAQCHGFNVVTPVGENVVRLLGLRQPRPIADVAEGKSPFSIDAFRHERITPHAVVEGDGHFGMRYQVIALDRGFAWLRVNEHDGLGVTAPVLELKVVQ